MSGPPFYRLDGDRLGNLTRALDDAAWGWDVAADQVSWNSAMESRFGHPQGAAPLRFDSWMELVAPNDRRRVAEALKQAVAGAETGWSLEYRLRRGDGSYATVLDRGHVERRDGAATWAAGLLIDVSTFKTADSALQELEEQHRQILDAITDWVLVKGPRSRIVWGNKAFREAYGMTNEQLQGLIDAPFVEPDDTQRYVRDDTQVFQTGRPIDIPDEPGTRHDGRTIRLHTVKSPIFDTNGQVVMTVGVSRDITDRKEMEGQLLLAERMASVGTLAAGIAHEINNPLSYVMSNLELLAEDLVAGAPEVVYDPNNLTKLVDQARDGAERVRNIIRGLRMFSRDEEERPVPQNLLSVLDDAVSMAGNEIRHRARVVRSYGAVPLVDADQTRLTQVFVNLLVNAAHAIPEGRADVNEIHVSTSTGPGGAAIVELRDTGAGIPTGVLNRIFDPFFTTKPVGVGTGLGLSVCHGIVTKLGGEISVTSTVGVGTTFRILLPAAKDDRPARPTSSGMAVASAGRRGRVLIVDDDVFVAETLMRVLAREHEVEVLHDGRAALDLMRSGSRFDVIFCDLMMPVVTGMDVHSELGKIAPEQVERMVLITGGAFSEQTKAFLNSVNNPRLDKPFAVQSVRSLVRSMIR